MGDGRAKAGRGPGEGRARPGEAGRGGRGPGEEPASPGEERARTGETPPVCERAREENARVWSVSRAK